MTEVVRPSETLVLRLLLTCLSYSATLKTEAVRSSKMSANIYKTQRGHIPEGSILERTD
jgi:hypothetical protein